MATTQSSGKWLPDVIRAIQAVGGSASLSQIYRWIERTRTGLPDEWEAAVRATIYHHSSDAKAYKKGNPDVFCNKDRGVWAVRDKTEVLTGKTDNDLFLQVLTSMSREELESFSGRGDALQQHIKARVAELKTKYKIS
jgi:hypothetical protein